jgi:hypothetical protein
MTVAPGTGNSSKRAGTAQLAGDCFRLSSGLPARERVGIKRPCGSASPVVAWPLALAFRAVRERPRPDASSAERARSLTQRPTTVVVKARKLP